MRDRESWQKTLLLLSFTYMNHKFFESEDGISSYIPSRTFSPFAFWLWSLSFQATLSKQ